MLDQAHEPALAHKVGRVVLASAIDRDDFRRRRIEDCEQTKESRHPLPHSGPGLRLQQHQRGCSPALSIGRHSAPALGSSTELW
jgi:hypothetical protein